MFDLVDPVGTGRRFLGFNRLERRTRPEGIRFSYPSVQSPRIAPETLSQLVSSTGAVLEWCHAVSCHVVGFPALIETQAKPADPARISRR